MDRRRRLPRPVSPFRRNPAGQPGAERRDDALKRAHATKPMALYRTREDDAIAPVLNPRPPDR
ncbi:protein of unassigned function [Methylobacterium oryzae CBMB20]|uniref:Protein of unassigned function n=1 Tax=Methylobacterium oryzae CBMB20 TaxID=693986 RepID=A0A089NV47_9HYPH|nr:protein of unassigned function [Methylobacterium oryzae CBMB20]